MSCLAAASLAAKAKKKADEKEFMANAKNAKRNKMKSPKVSLATVVLQKSTVDFMSHLNPM